MQPVQLQRCELASCLVQFPLLRTEIRRHFYSQKKSKKSYLSQGELPCESFLMRRTLLTNHCPLRHAPLKTCKIARGACVPTHCTLLSHWGPCSHSSHPYWLEQKLAQPWRKMRFNKRFNYLSQPLELPAGVGSPLEQLHLDLAKPSQLPLPELWKVIWKKFPQKTLGSHLTRSIMLCSLRQVCLAKKLITCYIQLHPGRMKKLKKRPKRILPVISPHLIFTPHAHLMFELKIEWLQELKQEQDYLG